jgi:hypothetical protein
LRDYDKNPIIIKDYNYIFMPLYSIFIIPLCIFVIIVNPGNVNHATLAICFCFCFIPAIDKANMLFALKNKRKIILSNKTIKFMHEDKVAEEIHLVRITDIRRTHSDIYHKSQEPPFISRIFLPITFPLILTLWHLPLIMMKFIFLLLRGDIGYRFLSSFIVFSNNKFINIFPTTEKEYKDIIVYFRTKKPAFDVENAKIFWNIIGHKDEKIIDKRSI